jgi:bacteriocin-like protein
MKIKNIFKKNEKKSVKLNSEKLDNKQLEKVIGGAEESVILKFFVKGSSNS